MEKLPTHRLLAYYKKNLREPVCIDEEYNEARKAAKEILDTREHIVKKEHKRRR